MSRALHDFVASIASALIISPHLDDGVFSCGAFMAAHPGCTLLTIFAGLPADPTIRTEWDRLSGFADAAEAMAARRMEDRAATEALQAECHWLDFVDDQYAQRNDELVLKRAIRASVERFSRAAVLVPLGLFHSDHLRVSTACVALLRERKLEHCIAYEDALYRRQEGATQTRLAALAAEGIVATPVAPIATSGHYARKRVAVGQYVSQLHAFGSGGYDDLLMPERYWWLQGVQDLQ